MLNSHDPLGMMMMTALGMVTVLGMVTLLGMVTVLGILTIIEYKLTGTDRRTNLGIGRHAFFLGKNCT